LKRILRVRPCPRTCGCCQRLAPNRVSADCRDTRVDRRGETRAVLASCAGGAGNRDERKQKRDLWKQAAHPQCLSAPMRRPLVAHSFFVPHVVDLRRLFPHTGDVRSAVTATSARASRHFPPHAGRRRRVLRDSRQAQEGSPKLRLSHQTAESARS
jgi:hypothetical protein